MNAQQVSASPGSTRVGRGFAPWRDLPALLWLLAVPVVSVAHPLIPEPRWLLLHLLLLGAVTHSIVVWSQHFADTLLHSPSGPQTRLLMLLVAGTLVVVVGTQTAHWQLTLIGALGVAGAVCWHAVRLARQLSRALPSRFNGVVRYYICAAALLPVGATLGVLMVRGLPDPWHGQVLVAHVAINLLGWVGITVAGTTATLWPTMLRTRLADGTDAALRRVLPLLLLGTLVTSGASLAGAWPLAAVGLLGYLAGWLLLARPLAEAAWRKPPAGHPTWSMGAGLLWLLGCLVAWTAILAVGGGADPVLDRFGTLVPYLAAGFAAQVLLGALGYLVPTALGGGGQAVRAGNEVLDRAGALRIASVNLGLIVCLLPAPSAVIVAASLVVLVGLAAQLVLLVLAIRASRRAKRTGEGPPLPDPADAPMRRRRALGSAVTGVSVVAFAVVAGVAFDPSALTVGPVESAAAGVAATGETTTVRVEADDMRFVPDTIEVPAGNHLVIELVNTDTDVHDLVLETGADSGRLSPGDTTLVDVGVVGRSLDGWCSLVGHRQMGMTLTVEVTGAPEGGAPTASDDSGGADSGGADSDGSDSDGHEMDGHGSDGHGSDGHGHDGSAGESAAYDPTAEPGPDFAARDPELAPLPPGRRTHRVTLTVSEVEREVAPGVTQRIWTYNGHAPGPTLHGRVGDRFVITLVNDGTIGHSIDFHAGALAPDRPMRTIPPGERLTYRFTAERAGIWMYHCSTMPMSVHIANGMYGAVVIEPDDLDPVDRSFLLVQAEQYFGPQGEPVDADKLAGERPDTVVFNGYPNQYDHEPIDVAVDERIRIWVLDAGPNRATSFHIVGGQFDTTWAEGSYLLRRGGPDGQGGSQALALGPAQGGFVELALPEAGHYPFVSHAMVDAERGARGILRAE